MYDTGSFVIHNHLNWSQTSWGSLLNSCLEVSAVSHAAGSASISAVTAVALVVLVIPAWTATGHIAAEGPLSAYPMS